MNAKKKLAGALRWAFGGRLLIQVVNWTLSLMVIRILSTDDYGLMAAAMVMINLLSMINELGLKNAVARMQDTDTETLQKIHGLILIFNGAVAVLTILSAPLVATYFEEPRLQPLITTLGVSFPIMALGQLSDALLLRQMNFKSRALVELLANLVSGIVVLVLAWSGAGVWSLVAGHLLVVSINTAGFRFSAPFAHPPVFDFRAMGNVVTFGGMIMLQRFLWWFYTSFDSILITKLFGVKMLGIYTVAMHLASLPNKKLNHMINWITYPAFSDIQNDKEEVRRQLGKALGVMAVVIFPLFWGLSSITEDIIPVVLGEKWIPAIFSVKVLSLVMPFHMLSTPVNEVPNVLNRPKVGVLNNGIMAVILSLTMWAASPWGLEGIVTARVLGALFALGILTHLAGKVTGVNLLYALQIYAKPVVAAAIMYLVVTVVRTQLPWPEPSGIKVIVLILTGGAVYVGAIFRLDASTCRRVIKLARS